MGILNKIITEQKDKKDKIDLSICESCGKKMVDNTFKSGSRLGGTYDCACGNSIRF